MQGIIGFVFRIFFRLLRQPFFLGMALSGTAVFVLADAQRRKKVFELLGL